MAKIYFSNSESYLSILPSDPCYECNIIFFFGTVGRLTNANIIFINIHTEFRYTSLNAIIDFVIAFMNFIIAKVQCARPLTSLNEGFNTLKIYLYRNILYRSAYVK